MSSTESEEIEKPKWRDVTRPTAEAITGFWLLAALNGWDVAPRWVMLSAGWIDLVLGSVIAITTIVFAIAYWWSNP